MSIADTLKDLARTATEWPLKRPDGEVVQRVHPYRRMMWYLMPGRNESVVYYDDYVKADALLGYVQRARAAFGTEVDITHCVVSACGSGFHQVPQMNQFVVGKRLYKRNHVAVSFSMKRVRKDKAAKLAAVKLRFDDPTESFRSVCERMNGSVAEQRSDKRTSTDKELDLFSKVPRPLLTGMVAGVRWLDAQNLLPAKFIEHDPFYTSMMVANLGSLGMRAAFHHLYEYGTCSLFLMVGQIEDRPVCIDGKVVPQKTLHLRWAYDERIDDGLTSSYGMAEVRNRLENPDQYFGELPALPQADQAAPAPAASKRRRAS
jgi:hypothetical protein